MLPIRILKAAVRVVGRRLNGKLPITWLLAVGFTGLTTLAVGIVFYVGIQETQRITLQLLAERGGQALAQVVRSVDGILDPVRRQMALMTESVTEGRIDLRDRDQITGLLVGSLSANPQMVGIGYVTANGIAYRATRGERELKRVPLPGGEGLRRQLQEIAKARAPEWLPPVWSTILQQTVVTLRVPVFDENDQFLGVLEAAVGVGEVSRGLAQSSGLGETAVILYDHDWVLAHPSLASMTMTGSDTRPLPRLEDVGDPVLTAIWGNGTTPKGRFPVLLRQFDQEATLLTLEANGQAYIFLYREIRRYGDKPWILGFYIKDDVVEEAFGGLEMLARTGIFVLLASIALSLVLAKLIRRPIHEFARASEAVEAGDLENIAPLRRSPVREFDEGARSFNSMIDGLRDREKIRDLFGRFVPANVAADLLHDPSRLSLDGVRREVSVIFTDISGFTTLSESWPPEKVVPLLNKYLGIVCQIIADEGGIVVDFIGDAVFGLFGAPQPMADHAATALRAARRIDRATRDFAEAVQNKGLPFGYTRIGLYSGMVTVGNFGAADRLKYGAAGDAVNTAARIETANKAFGTLVLAGSAIVALTGDTDCRPVGRVALRGRSEPVDLWEILPPGAGQDPWIIAFRAAYTALMAGDPGAREALRHLAEERPDDQVIGWLLDASETSSRPVLYLDD